MYFEVFPGPRAGEIKAELNDGLIEFSDVGMRNRGVDGFWSSGSVRGFPGSVRNDAPAPSAGAG